MPCGAILTFEPLVDRAIRELWKGIAKVGPSPEMTGLDIPPHLTLLACVDIDLLGLQQAGLVDFLAGQPAMQVDFPGLGVFSGPEPVVYLTVTPEPWLIAFHNSFWKLAARFCSGLNHFYSPDIWVPHVTLNHSLPIQQTGAVIQALMQMPVPAQGILAHLHVMYMRDSPNSLFTYDLPPTAPSQVNR